MCERVCFCALTRTPCVRTAGLSRLPKLTTLDVSRNLLTDDISIKDLEACPELSSLNLCHNQLNTPDVFGVLRAIPKLCSLQLKGNPVIAETRHYRKTTIAAMPRLGYLDDAPVFPQDRECLCCSVAVCLLAITQIGSVLSLLREAPVTC